MLERDGRRVRLTPAAHALVTRADRVLAELDAAEAELAAEHETVRGRVVIGAFPSAAAEIVLPASEELARRHPELSCHVREHEPEDGIPLLRSGELDVLVSESYEGVEEAPVGGLESHPLLAEPLLLLLPGTQYAAAIEQACRAAGFSPRVVHRADEAMLIQALAAAGLGVGLLPALARSGAHDLRCAAATPEPPRRVIAALVRRGATGRPALAATLEALERRAQRTV